MLPPKHSSKSVVGTAAPPQWLVRQEGRAGGSSRSGGVAVVVVADADAVVVVVAVVVVADVEC